MMVICAAYGCQARSGNHKVTFHHFPKDLKYQKIWCERLGRGQLGDQTKVYVPTKHSKLCSSHFEDDQYICPSDLLLKGVGFNEKFKRLLKKDALPTIFLDENVKPSKRKPQHMSKKRTPFVMGPKKTESERKRVALARQKRFRAKLVNIGDQTDKWQALKAIMGAENDCQVAKTLIESYLETCPASTIRQMETHLSMSSTSKPAVNAIPESEVSSITERSSAEDQSTSSTPKSTTKAIPEPEVSSGTEGSSAEDKYAKAGPSGVKRHTEPIAPEEVKKAITHYLETRATSTIRLMEVKQSTSSTSKPAAKAIPEPEVSLVTEESSADDKHAEKENNELQTETSLNVMEANASALQGMGEQNKQWKSVDTYYNDIRPTLERLSEVQYEVKVKIETDSEQREETKENNNSIEQPARQRIDEQLRHKRKITNVTDADITGEEPNDSAQSTGQCKKSKIETSSNVLEAAVSGEQGIGRPHEQWKPFEIPLEQPNERQSEVKVEIETDEFNVPTAEEVVKKQREKRTTSVMYVEQTCDDNILYCVDCKQEHEGDCPAHGPLIVVQNMKVEENDPDRALHSLPPNLLVKESNIDGAGLGVFTDTEILPGTTYGPYEGINITDPEQANASGYCWQAFNHDRCVQLQQILRPSTSVSTSAQSCTKTLTAAERSKKYRQSLKENPKKWSQYKQTERERKRRSLRNRTEEQINEDKRKSRERQKRFRDKRKMLGIVTEKKNEKKKKVLTIMEREKQREYWRRKQSECRKKRTGKKHRISKEKDRQYRRDRRSENGKRTTSRRKKFTKDTEEYVNAIEELGTVLLTDLR